MRTHTTNTPHMVQTFCHCSHLLRSHIGVQFVCDLSMCVMCACIICMCMCLCVWGGGVAVNFAKTLRYRPCWALRHGSSSIKSWILGSLMYFSVLQCVAVCCSVLQHQFANAGECLFLPPPTPVCTRARTHTHTHTCLMFLQLPPHHSACLCLYICLCVYICLRVYICLLICLSVSSDSVFTRDREHDVTYICHVMSCPRRSHGTHVCAHVTGGCAAVTGGCG